MNLDDYVNKKEQFETDYKNRIKNIKRWVTFFQKIDRYSSIPEAKVSLIKDFGKYIESYKFNYTANPTTGNGAYVLIQVKTTDNNSMAAMIERKEATFVNYTDFSTVRYMTEEEYNKSLIEHLPWSYNTFRTLTHKFISEEEYYRRLNQFQLIGSQEFAAISLTKFAYDIYSFADFESARNYYAFYSSDGNIFMTNELANDLKNHTSTYELSNYLADEAMKIKHKNYPY